MGLRTAGMVGLLLVAWEMTSRPVLAEPLMPTGVTAEAAWEDGPDGAYWPLITEEPGLTWHVQAGASAGGDGSPGSPFASIAEGLAVAVAGDKVVVHAGVYHEQIVPPLLNPAGTRGRSVHLLAEPADGASVIIDGTGVEPLLEGNLDHPAGVSIYRDTGFILEGFAIRNWVGYGVAVVQSSDAQILGCSLRDNGSLMAEAVDLVLLSSVDVRVFENSFAATGTDRALDDRATDSWIALNDFSGYTASAVKIGPHPAGHGCRLEYNAFFDNPASQGVVFVDGALSVTVQRNLLVRGSYQAIRLDGAEYSSVLLNTATGFYSGLELRSLVGCRLIGNLLAGNTLGIEFLNSFSGSQVDYNLYFDNEADLDGGGQTGPHAVFGDPDFVAAAEDDYGLGADSAARNAGPDDLPAPEGGGVRVDLGALEAGAGDQPYLYQPRAAVADLSPMIAWAFAANDGGGQGKYRVQLDSQPTFDTPALLDSNWQVAAQPSWIVPAGFERQAGRWYARVKTQDATGKQGAWSSPQVSFDLQQPPACAAQGGTGCALLDACSGDWLVAADHPRCCQGDCQPCPDADQDGFQSDACGGADCDDGAASINPEAAEVCDNGVDDDCDGETDLDDSACGCIDHDRDGFGENCADGADCDDGIASVHPGATEECNYVDDNCDGQTDEGFDLQSDPENCGECAWPCGAAQVCDLGQCAAGCSGGRTACDRACLDTSSDLEHCGDCDRVCDLDHASEACQGGECLLTSCESGWVDLNALPQDGCEYACVVDSGGVEICDNQTDDNCDGRIDESECQGGSDGGGGCASAPSGVMAWPLPLLWIAALFRVGRRRFPARRPGR